MASQRDAQEGASSSSPEGYGFQSDQSTTPENYEQLKPKSLCQSKQNSGYQIMKKDGQTLPTRPRRRRLQHYIRHGYSLGRANPEPQNSTPPDHGPALDKGAPVSRDSPLEIPTVESISGRLSPPGSKYPEFDSMDRHFIPKEIADNLRRDEANRLLAIVRSPDKPLALGQTKLLSGMRGDKEGYRKLSRLSKGVSTAQNLCLLDNECINVGFCSRLASQERMQKLVKQAQLAADTTSLGDEEGQTKDYESDDFIHDMFQLINYISAIIIRLSSQTAYGDYWLSNIMAVLVARVAKIKVILMEIVRCANESAAIGAECLDKLNGATGKASGFSLSIVDEEEECEEALRLIDANTREGLTSEEDADISAYCVAQNKFRSGINATFKYILGSLRLSNRSGLPATNYEMCAVAYDIGFEGIKTVLFQDRDLEYSASSDRNTLNTAQSAFSILHQTLTGLKDRVGEQKEDSVSTLIEWAFLEETKPNPWPSSGAGGINHSRLRESIQSIQVNGMDNIVEVMVPLIATSPISLSNFTNFRTMVALTGGVEDEVSSFEEGQFGAFFSLYTNEFKSGAKGQEILRLSTAFKEQRFSRYNLLVANKHKRWARQGYDLQRVSTQQLQSNDYKDVETEMQRNLDHCAVKMNQWVIDENSVTVSCKKYVSIVVATGLVIVAGGLAMGLSVGDRIEGVDPFNLATYTWALAAFIILVSKSVLVEDWTWSDFLRQRVRCRSVSELAAATHVDPKLVIAKLLHDDCNGTILSTRGPFNSVFRRQTNGSEGFSIDRPIDAETLMLSGIALLKVATPRGHSIVCLDYRCGTFLTVLQHQMGTENVQLVCEDLSRIPREKRSGDHRDSEPVHLRLVKRENFKWKRIQGLYEFRSANVVFE